MRTVFLITLSSLASLDIRSASPGSLADVQFDGDSVVMELDMSSGYPMVNVVLDHKRKANFVVDTGASISVIDPGIAKKLGLVSVGRQNVGPPGMKGEETDIVRLDHLSAGALTVRQADLAVVDIVELTQGLMDGVIGMDLFRDLLITLRLAEGKLEISHQSLSSDSPNVMKLGDDENLNIEMDVTGFFVDAHLDSGSPGGFTLPPEMKNSLKLASGTRGSGAVQLVGSSRTLEYGKLVGSIHLGTIEYKNPDIAFMSPSLGKANIGHSVMRNLVITIDQKNKLLSMVPANNEALADHKRVNTASTSRRLGIMFKGFGGGPLQLAGVEPDSLAERSGFKAGDQINTLNGKPMADYVQNELRNLFSGQEPLVFEVDRDGQIITLKVP